jgi:mono/diheme cytochrome c family protein
MSLVPVGDRRHSRAHALDLYSCLMPLSRAPRLLIAMLTLQPPATASVWNGVYAAPQAERGRVVYEARCSRCHGSDLRGVNGSSLAGAAFMLHWEGRTVDRLFRRIHETMPPEDAGTMTERDAVDTVAYLLQRNGFPEGPNELALEPAALENIQIKSGTGPALVRSGALVQVSGCLMRNRDDGWVLDDATEPEIATLDAQPTDKSNPGTARAAEIVHGTRTISLMNVFPNPGAHTGHTMRARGFLIRDAAGDRINVVTLEMVESRCAR